MKLKPSPPLSAAPTNRVVLERLRFLDFLIDHYGVFKRRYLVDYFGISLSQASLDIVAYTRLVPANIAYDKTSRVYRRTAAYVRHFA